MPRHYDEALRQVGDIDSVYRSISTGFEKGAAVPVKAHKARIGKFDVPKVHSWKVDYASGSGKRPCLSPVTIYRTGRPKSKARKPLHVVDVRKQETVPVNVEMQVPCRRCDNCLKRRSQHWYMRALSETRAAQRTWFGSLTLSPEQHVRVAAACRIQMAENGDDFDLLPQGKQFAMRHACISRELTLYLKRVRKRVPSCKFSFVCVVEAHTEKLNGLPHYHMLIHEAPGSSPVPHRILSNEWRVGFSNWKLLVTATKVGYVTKYLSKSMLARVRASIDYGKEKRPQDIVISKK